MHEKGSKQLLEKLLSIDKLITEQLLNLEWNKPQLQLIKREKLSSYRMAKNTISEQGKNQGAGDFKTQCDKHFQF